MTGRYHKNRVTPSCFFHGTVILNNIIVQLTSNYIDHLDNFHFGRLIIEFYSHNWFKIGFQCVLLHCFSVCFIGKIQ